MTDLLVRMYNVRFGDAVLVAIPDEDGSTKVDRHILFDFGNALGTEGGADAVLEPVVDDILEVLGGRPLDLYVMTHEHLDHVQGLFYAFRNLNKTVPVRQAWLTGSAHPGYYDSHPDARKKRLAAIAAYNIAAPRLRAAGDPGVFANVLMANNDTSTTRLCIDYLRQMTPTPGDVHYVDRTTDLSTLQPARSASITLWAPEEDTADYYGRFEPLVSTLRIGDNTTFDDLLGIGAEPADMALPQPPPGVDAGAFYNLIDIRNSSQASTLLQIDKASNNTSVVLCLEWHGWRLLFPGDAEKRSWKTMDSVDVIKPVHFLKLSHHGSHTGMPPTAILDKLLPMPPPDNRTRQAAVSTFPDTYEGVPDGPTLTEIGRRAELRSTTDLDEGELFIDLKFPG